MISVFCSEKLDGVAAAAIIFRHATLAKLPVHFGGFVHPQSFSDELEDIRQDEGKLLFILDAKAEPDDLPILDKINEKNKLVYWCTPESDSIIPPSKIFDKGKSSAAELVQTRFLPNDPVAKQLVELAKEVKFWQVKTEHASKLADLIAAQYNPLDLLQSLSKGILWSSQMAQFHKEYLKRKEDALTELMDVLTIKNYVNTRFGFSLAQAFLPSADACERILTGHAGVDVAVILYRDGKIIFRRRDNIDIDLKTIAELFGGGGHAFAAGAKLKLEVTKDSFPDALFYVDQVLKNFFLKSNV